MSSGDPFAYLSAYQKSVLAQGKIKTPQDLLLNSPVEVARRCKITPGELASIVQEVSKAIAPAVTPLSKLMEAEAASVFTTGCSLMDELLGGGIRPSMLWEVAGESAAGKTQLALRLTLTVQLPPELGGLGGAACYLTTKSELQTKRLMEIRDSHDKLSSEYCSFDDIHHVKVPTIDRLTMILETGIPQLIHQLEQKPERKPVRLVVLDALTELFHEHDKTDKSILFERSRRILPISTLLHNLASKHNIAIIVLNEVMAYIEFGTRNDPQALHERSYRRQSRFFNQADSIPGENRKEAQLGLVWANQVNARIMFSRTGRRRHIDHPSHKRSPASPPGQPATAQLQNDEPTLIRRCTVIFSSVSEPASIDYIVNETGIVGIDEIIPLAVPSSQPPPSNIPLRVDDTTAPTEHDDYDAYFEEDDQFFGSVDIEALTGLTATQADVNDQTQAGE